MSDLDARTFQSQLDELTTTIAYKVQREGPRHGLKPDFLAADFFFILRQAQWTYNLFRFINADERRKKDTDWRVQYSAVILPLVRTIIDCFYNISSILQNPGEKGQLYRASGFKRMLEAIEANERRYAGDPRWDAYIVKRRTDIDLGMRGTGFAETEVRTAALWPLLALILHLQELQRQRPINSFSWSSLMVSGRNIRQSHMPPSRGCLRLVSFLPLTTCHMMIRQRSMTQRSR